MKIRRSCSILAFVSPNTSRSPTHAFSGSPRRSLRSFSSQSRPPSCNHEARTFADLNGQEKRSACEVPTWKKWVLHWLKQKGRPNKTLYTVFKPFFSTSLALVLVGACTWPNEVFYQDRLLSNRWERRDSFWAKSSRTAPTPGLFLLMLGHLFDLLQIHQPLVTRTLPGAPGIATRSKDATRGSWPYY